MSDNKLTFTLTGNFQYDLGILGLKRVLDFFDIKYESDDPYYISIERDREKLLEDIIAKLTIDNGVDYFYEKVIENLKSNKAKKGKKNKSKSKIEEKINISEEDLKNEYKTNNLSGLIEKISYDISKKLLMKKKKK